jgi:predicted membrane protein
MDHLLLRSGAANVEISGMGYASPREVQVEGGVGNIILDFGGPWSGSSQVKVTAGVGSLTLRFPEDVGVRIVMEGGLGSVKTGPGWRLSEGAYVNNAYGQSEATIQVTLITGVGSVTVE